MHVDNVQNLTYVNTSSGHGGHGFGGPDRGRDSGMRDVVSKYFEHAMKDGKLDRKEVKTLEKLAKAAREEKGCDDKKDCEESKRCEKDQDCGKSKDCRDDSKCGGDLATRYINEALEDGKFSRFEQRIAKKLFG
jgi:hypothetical protein